MQAQHDGNKKNGQAMHSNTTSGSRAQARASEQPQAQPRVVIVGAGFGGLEAAKALRHAPVQVTVIDRWNHHLFHLST